MAHPAVPAAGRLDIETSDHVVLRYRLAGPGMRAQAAIYDSLIVMLMVVGLSIVASRTLPDTEVIAGLVILSIPAVVLSYFAILEWLWNGQTFGKRRTGLRVISAEGAPAGFTACLIRNLVRLVDFLPFAYGVGFVAIIFGPQAQRLGDLAAGTFVVHSPEPQVDWLSLRTIAPVAPGPHVEVGGLPGEVQRLVREFVAREQALSAADRARLAALIAARVRHHLADDTDDDFAFIKSVARGLRAAGTDGSERGAA